MAGDDFPYSPIFQGSGEQRGRYNLPRYMIMSHYIPLGYYKIPLYPIIIPLNDVWFAFGITASSVVFVLRRPEVVRHEVTVKVGAGIAAGSPILPRVCPEVCQG